MMKRAKYFGCLMWLKIKQKADTNSQVQGKKQGICILPGCRIFGYLQYSTPPGVPSVSPVLYILPILYPFPRSRICYDIIIYSQPSQAH